MTRIKRGTISHKRRKKVFKLTKGFKWGRKKKYSLAKDALKHAWKWSYQDRKDKKGNFRAIWQTHINAASRKYGITFSVLIKGLKDNKIEIDRKILSQLAMEKPEIFQKIVESIKK